MNATAEPANNEWKSGMYSATYTLMKLAGLPQRKHLPHEVPSWVEQGGRHFITINHRNRGSDPLCRENLPYALLDSVLHYETIRNWYPWIVLVMPDHLHGIFTFDLRNRRVSSILRAWKSYQSKNLGITWQSGYFEHRLRNETEFAEKANYIRMNPVRKGLVENPKDWPWVIDRTNLDDRTLDQH